MAEQFDGFGDGGDGGGGGGGGPVVAELTARIAVLEEESKKKDRAMADMVAANGKGAKKELAAVKKELAKKDKEIAKKDQAHAKALAKKDKEGAKKDKENTKLKKQITALKKKPGRGDAERLAAANKKEKGIVEYLTMFPGADTTAVGLSKRETIKEEEKREAFRLKMKKKLLPNRKPGRKVPDSVQLWLDGKHAEINEPDKMRAQAVEVAQWLLEIITHSYLDPELREAAVSLLIKERFTANLGFLRQWDFLRAGLKKHLDSYAKDMKEIFDDHNLDELLSHEVVGGILGEATGKASQVEAMPFLEQDLDYTNGLEAFTSERVALHAMMLVAIAIDPLYQEKIREVCMPFLDDEKMFEAGPVKNFLRPLLKALSDYRDKLIPVAHNLDLVRDMVAPRNVRRMMQLLARLRDEFGELPKWKNVHGMTEGERALRFHLPSIMLTVLFDSGLTYDDLLADPAVQAKWDAYAKKSQGEPQERWDRDVAAARKLLAEQGDAPVKMLCETQLLLEQFVPMRERIHDPYQAYRPADAMALCSDFVQASGTYVPAEPKSKVHQAADHGQRDQVRKLLDAGGDVNDKKKSTGSSALYFASQNNHLDVVHLLLKRGAAVDAADSNGVTPLRIASANGHLEVATMLLDRGATVDAVNEHGMTPLFQAANFGHAGVVGKLIECNANVWHKTTWGTPLDIATKNGHDEVAAVLRAAGAK